MGTLWHHRRFVVSHVRFQNRYENGRERHRYVAYDILNPRMMRLPGRNELRRHTHLPSRETPAQNQFPVAIIQREDIL
jgi:hypothetical protein